MVRLRHNSNGIDGVGNVEIVPRPQVALPHIGQAEEVALREHVLTNAAGNSCPILPDKLRHYLAHGIAENLVGCQHLLKQPEVLIQKEVLIRVLADETAE